MRKQVIKPIEFIPTIKTREEAPTVIQNKETVAKLKLALKIAGMHHTYSMCQVVGIYPT